MIFNASRSLPKVGEKWRNWKTGAEYEIIGVGRHTETGEWLVTYRNPVKNLHDLHNRPLDMFMGTRWVPDYGVYVYYFEKVEEN